MLGPILLQIILIFLNATFASAEIAVISMNETKLKNLAAAGNPRAKKLASLTEQPARFLATIQVAITLAGLLGSAFAAENFAEPLVALMINAGISIPKNILQSISVVLITLILSYFSLIFGELVPKRIAMKKTEAMALGLSNLLYWVAKFFAPVVFLLTCSTNLILRLIGIDPNEADAEVSEEDIRMLLVEGNQQGTINADEREMIQNVFEFDDILVEQICTHRIDVTTLHISDSMETWESMINSSRHTYYPVCGENRDDILGVLDTKDYFRSKNKSREYIMENAVDKAYFIPETMKANILFQHMKQSRRYFSIILDEYGGMSGIITLHDLIEALVGDLDEIEEPTKPKEIEQLAENSWRIQGYAELDNVSETIGITLPTENFDTYSGFICHLINRVPNDDESFECTFDNLVIHVHSVKNHRIGNTTLELLTE